jgi:hypothetical protein
MSHIYIPYIMKKEYEFLFLRFKKENSYTLNTKKYEFIFFGVSKLVFLFLEHGGVTENG